MHIILLLRGHKGKHIGPEVKSSELKADAGVSEAQLVLAENLDLTSVSRLHSIGGYYLIKWH
jgi:hypothetical protein